MRGLALILALLPGIAAAAPVTVQSGEHVDFSRLVLGFDASAGWTLGRVPGGYEFRASDGSIAFDTSEVFKLIPHDRIAAVESPSPGVLRLTVDCACHIDAFELRRSRIVIDVKDGPAPAGDNFEKPLEDGLASAPAPTPVPVPVPDPLAGRLADAVAPKNPVPLDLPDMLPPPDANFDIARATRTRAFEDAVLQEMARAGAQGLVIPAEDRSLKSAQAPAEAQPEPAAPPAEPAAAAQPAETPPSDAGHVKIETAVDRDALGAGTAPVTADGGACPPPSLIDITAWGHMTGGLPDIAQAREGLVGEFDAVDPDRALSLARTYIWLGFGAEAKTLLSYVAADNPARPVVGAMAEIVDHEGSTPVGMALDGFESCDSSAALWAVLAGAPLVHGQAVDARAVVRALNELPDQLQRLLGPRLVAAFTAIDDSRPPPCCATRSTAIPSPASPRPWPMPGWKRRRATMPPPRRRWTRR